MEVLFSHILSISLQASVAAIIIILVKKLILNRVNIRIGYMLWALLLVRLLIPVLPAAPVSIYNYIGYQEPSWLSQAKSSRIPTSLTGTGSYKSNSAITTASAGSATSVGSAGTAGSAASVASGAGVDDNVSSAAFAILSYIWAAGALGGLIYLISSNIAFSAGIRRLKPIALPEEMVSRLRSEMRLKGTVKFAESPTITSPYVTGIFCRRVILPAGLIDRISYNSLLHVAAHEFAHIKHKDLIFTWLSSLLCCIHWFNPVVWICAALVKQEQELCADAHVMSLLDDNGKLEYGETLLAIAKRSGNRHPSLVAAGISEGRRSLKSRIKSIAVFSNKKYRITLAGLLLVAVAAIFVCTSAYSYPKTADESMKFDENIQFEMLSDNATNPRRLELRIHNYNKIAIHSCELGIYDGNTYNANSRRILGKSGFWIGAGQARSFIVENVDYYSANIKFDYRFGFGFGSQLRKAGRSGALRVFDKTAQINGWAPVSQEEAQQFIKDKKITPLGTSMVYNLFTIVLFKNGSNSGYYELYKDTKQNKVMSRLVQGTETQGDQPVITRMGGTASGSFPYVCIRINDPSIYNAGEKIELETEYGTKTEYLWGASAYAFDTKGFRNINKFVIYDRNGNRIYDGE